MSDPRTPNGERPVNILFICRGNQCRSPFAEYYVRSKWGDRIETRSCGVMDLPPTPSPPETVMAASELGVDLSSHRSNALSRTDINGVDLFIGFEQIHIATVAVDYGAPIERCYLLTEISDLLSDGEVIHAKGLEVLSLAFERRKPWERSVWMGVEDPVGRPIEVHRRVLREIAAHCEKLARSLSD